MKEHEAWLPLIGYKLRLKILGKGPLWTEKPYETKRKWKARNSSETQNAPPKNLLIHDNENETQFAPFLPNNTPRPGRPKHNTTTSKVQSPTALFSNAKIFNKHKKIQHQGYDGATFKVDAHTSVAPLPRVKTPLTPFLSLLMEMRARVWRWALNSPRGVARPASNINATSTSRTDQVRTKPPLGSFSLDTLFWPTVILIIPLVTRRIVVCCIFLFAH